MVFVIEGGKVTSGLVRVGEGLVKDPRVKLPKLPITDGRLSGFCDFPKGKFRPLTREAALVLADELVISR